ncbi:MAG: nicotinate-nucleotide--dimethylbenzimidazole phosphoribosyltransferase [Oscillospiraceae bacterium]|jgi:nicotinate-nucleotide--dimethylbenzimidazole phosphoribosyltransferase|nr:nicotinate-nucleotide--dimethylbenzimidazole phosphoribosyltransferase [Oscillospiraceae bacterium]
MEDLEILEGRLARALAAIRPMNQEGPAAARRHWDAVAKPLNGLGQLEEVIARMAGTAPLKREVRKCVVPFCADNGVVAEGVTQTDSSVTAVVAGNMLTGAASVCCMGRVAGAAVLPVDAGMLTEVPGMRSIKVSRGTANLAGEPAMTRRQCLAVLLAGLELAGELAEEFDILAAGEMGIGNTTTSSAVAAALLERPAAEMTGKGAGLSDEGLRRKIEVIDRALARHRPEPGDPVDVISKVGGYDIAAMTGFYLGCALHRVPAVMDGFISTVAALAAVRLCPAAGDALIASHLSAEPGAGHVMEALGLRPLLRLGMALGEGTGAVSVMPLIDMALRVYFDMPSFDNAGIEAYQPL